MSMTLRSEPCRFSLAWGLLARCRPRPKLNRWGQQVGNPLTSWPTSPARHVVLDAQLCFSTEGAVTGLLAHLVGHGAPEFLTLEHQESGVEGSRWRVLARSAAALSAGRPSYLRLLEPLWLAPGQCLGWASGTAAVAYVETRPLGQEQVLPMGRDLTVSAMSLEEPAVGATLHFKTLQYRRHALRAEQVPAKNSFLHFALQPLHFKHRLGL